MNLFDMKTVFFSYTVSNAICAAVITLLWIQNRKHFAGLGFWLADFGMQFAAIVLIALRGVVPDLVSMVVSNALIILGTILLYVGLERFTGKHSTQIHNAILLALFILVHTYFAVMQPSLVACDVNLSLVSLALGLQLVWLMLYRVDVDMRPTTRGVGYMFVAFCAVSAIRIIVDLAVPPQNDFFHSNTFKTLLVLTYQMLFVVLTFGLVLMVNRRLFADLARDIATRQQVEEALRLSEEKFFKAFHASPDAILISRVSDGWFIEVNEGFSRLSEYSREEALASSSIALGIWANPQDRDRCISALRENHSVRDYEYDFRTKSGRILNCLYSGEIIYLGGEAHMLSVVRDMTERKRAEKALRESEKKYRGLVENISEVVYRMRLPDGVYEYVSPASEHVLGYPPAALYKNPLLIRQIIHPDFQAYFQEQWDDLFAGRVAPTYEYKIVDAQGRERWITQSNTGIVDEHGRMVALEGICRDVTALKQAEEALRASEQRYRMLAENATDVIWTMDLQGRFTYVSPSVERLRGYTPEEVMQQSIQEALTPESQPIALSGIQRVVEAELAGEARRLTPNRNELEQPCKDGSTVWTEAITRVMRDEQGRFAGILGVTRDISERRQMEKIMRLRLSLFEFAADHSLNELMQKALDEIGQITHSPIGFYHFVEADQKTLSLQAWSTRTLQEFCKAEGRGLHYSLDQAGVWVDCVHQRKPVIHNDYAALPASRRKGMPDGHAEVKRELVVPTLREGRIVSILGVGNKPSDYDEKDVELVAYVADVIWSIVERKHAETQLQDYQRRLEAQNHELRKLSLAIEQSGNTIVITDTAGTIQYANPRFEQTTGYTLREALGQNPRILKSGEQSADYYKTLWNTITSGQIWRGEFHNRRKDGTLYWESATIAPVQDAAGRVTNYIAIKEDITGIKQAQEALRQYAEQLEVQNAELDTFAHTVAHDLKNPVGIITGFAQVLVNDYETTSPQEIAQALHHILRAGKKLDAIIEELMLLAGVRQQEITPQSLDMSSIVREAIERLQMLIQGQQAHIALLDEAGWPVALGYAPWIEEVWANYIGNAIKYGAAEGVPPQIKLGADLLPLSGGMARFWVQDNGPGLSAEAQTTLFTPFARLDQVRAKGHGLGLSIVRRIVEKLGGQVGVESAPGQGSTFFFTLPVAAMTHTSPTASSS